MVHYRSYITTFIYINVLHSAMFSQSRRVTDRKMLTSFSFPLWSCVCYFSFVFPTYLFALKEHEQVADYENEAEYHRKQ